MQKKVLLKKALIAGALLTLMGTTVQAKETVIFGSYEQDGNIENGPENIEWEVLDKQGDRVLVLSKYILNNWRFHNSSPAHNVTWKDSSIRKKLNADFYMSAFTEDEQSLIQETTVNTTNNEYWETYGGESTTDKIFLLSLGELGKYYNINPGVQNSADENLVVELTEYARLNGAYGVWWLRTPGIDINIMGDAARIVNVHNSLLSDPQVKGAVNQNGGPVSGEEGVRPAMWISSSVLKDQVQKIQEALNDNGFDCGTPDGVAGGKTTEAIRAYQEANGLEQTGEVDTELLIKLGICENKETEPLKDNTADQEVDEKYLLTEITMGSYEGYDTKWIVIDVDNTSALLLSKYVIEKKLYNDTREDTTWESSSMREWLNNDYLSTFTDDEKADILLSHNYNTGDPDTYDYVFLLSVDEARELAKLSKDVYIATAEENTDFDHVEGKSLHETQCGWGLRSSAIQKDAILYIGYAGDEKAIYVDGNTAVRPAIRISLEDLEKYCADTSTVDTTDENSSEEITESETTSNTEASASTQSDIIASIDNVYPVDILAVKMVRKSGNQDVIHIKVRKNFEMAGNDQICVKYITVNNDGENVCDYGSAWVSALDQGQASWAHGNNVEDKITYEDLSYIKITEIDYFKDNQSYCLYSLPESIKVYKENIALEVK